ncbi:MAG: hypothetical protein HFJ35_07900 [Clostridia bacterium]|nr:hypothetical protein [Clostridia bacterium]
MKKGKETIDMEEIDLKEMFQMFWNKKIEIIVIILLFMIGGIIYTSEFTVPMYSSSTTLVLATSEDAETTANTTITATDITINSKLVSTYSELVKSKNILREVIYNLEVPIEEETLRKQVKVSSVKNTELIEIVVENEEAQTAAKIANEIAKVFTEKVKEIYNINNVQIVDHAEITSQPSNINYLKSAILFTGIGIVIAVIYVIVANMIDTTIKTAEDIEKNFNVPVLSSIPMIEKLSDERKYKR